MATIIYHIVDCFLSLNILLMFILSMFRFKQTLIMPSDTILQNKDGIDKQWPHLEYLTKSA